MNLQNVPVHPSYVNTNRATTENSVLRFTSLGKYTLSIPLSLIGPTPTISFLIFPDSTYGWIHVIIRSYYFLRRKNKERI